ncbi:MAG: DUF2811 domain-containing protein [Cyanobium sp.]
MRTQALGDCMDDGVDGVVRGERAESADPAEGERGGVVSLRADVPEALLHAMAAFIERHPNWDQYRLFQAALAGFLVQNGIQDRGVTRCYLANLFPTQLRFAAQPARRSPPRAGTIHGGAPSRTAA